MASQVLIQLLELFLRESKLNQTLWVLRRNKVIKVILEGFRVTSEDLKGRRSVQQELILANGMQAEIMRRSSELFCCCQRE